MLAIRSIPLTALGHFEQNNFRNGGKIYSDWVKKFCRFVLTADFVLKILFDIMYVKISFFLH